MTWPVPACTERDRKSCALRSYRHGVLGRRAQDRTRQADTTLLYVRLYNDFQGEKCSATERLAAEYSGGFHANHIPLVLDNCLCSIHGRHRSLSESASRQCSVVVQGAFVQGQQ